CARPSTCSTRAWWVRRSSATPKAPEPSSAGSGAVSHPRAVRRSAACWSCGSGGARTTASLPSTCVWACSVSHVALHVSKGNCGHSELIAGTYLLRCAAFDPAPKEIDLLGRPLSVARHGSGADCLQDRVCVLADVVVRPEVEVR